MMGKGLTGLAAAVGLHTASSGLAEAGSSFWALAQAQAQGGVTVQQGGARTYILEILVFVVLAGLALFVVCKTSRRV